MSKVVITGCTGSIGMALIDKHLSLNDTVYAIVRPSSTRIINLPKHKNLKIIKCDLNNLKSLKRKVKKADYFYHLGYSNVEKSLRNDAYLQMINIKHTMDAIKVAKDLGCKKFVGAGSQAEYGLSNDVLKETNKVDPKSCYGIAKYASGKLGLEYASSLNIEFNWTRIFSVYGIYDVESSIIKTCVRKMLKNEDIDLTLGTQNWEFMFSSDCANALYLVMMKGINGKTYNISSGESKKLKEYIFDIKKYLSSKSKLNFGIIKQREIVSLKSNIDSLISDTGFKSEVSFQEGINVIKNYYLEKEYSYEENSNSNTNI